VADDKRKEASEWLQLECTNFFCRVCVVVVLITSPDWRR
jgi:hypothetical protein